MSELIQYKLSFPCEINKETKQKELAPAQIRTVDEKLTFSIGKIKSRRISVVYFKFIGYDLRGDIISEYTSPRWVITKEYSEKYDTFTIPFNEGYDLDDLDRYHMEMYTIAITSENPLYFNHIQLNSGEKTEDYHQPNEVKPNVIIDFNKTPYVNLYDESETFLQIIRPNGEGFRTDVLTGSQETILAPHLPDESPFDDPVSLMYEYMYQREQRIGVEK